MRLNLGKIQLRKDPPHMLNRYPGTYLQGGNQLPGTLSCLKHPALNSRVILVTVTRLRFDDNNIIVCLLVDFIFILSPITSHYHYYRYSTHLQQAAPVIMKLSSSTLLLGTATAALASRQQPLQEHVKSAAKSLADGWTSSTEHLLHAIKDAPAEAKALWEEVSMLYPEAMEKATSVPPPKAYTRKPDSAWDHIMKGADIQSVWVENNQGQQERELDGKLDAYNLRTKKVDPSKLGVDTVKQYSGYLDDEENDKHLFYCR